MNKLSLAALLFVATSCSPETTGPNLPPVAVAGPDQTMTLGSAAAQVTLNASASYDPDDDALYYHWTVLSFPHGEHAALDDAQAPITYFVPTIPGLWIIALTVSDGMKLSERDLIRIEVSGAPCEDDDDCDDLDFCTGPETCQNDICQDGQPPDCDDEDPCTRDSCNTSTGSCEHLNIPIPGAEGPDTDPTCTDNLDNDCDGRTDLEDENCAGCDDAEDCDDQNPCTTDFCQSNICDFATLPAGNECDDGNYCNGPDECDSQGVCLPEGETPCPDACMTRCDESSASCQPDPAGDSCEGDGLDCTQDLCDGAGTCVIIPEQDSCDSPGLCLPECSMDGTGCVEPPATFDLTCQADGDDPESGLCTIPTDGLSNQEACLETTSQIVQNVLLRSDFTDGTNCDLDGWDLTFGDQCSENIVACTLLPHPINGWMPCDFDFTRICSMDSGLGVLTANAYYSIFHRKEWRMYRSLDATGSRDLELCLDVLEENADHDEWLLIQAYNADHPWPGDPIMCMNQGPGFDDNLRWYRMCRRLPEWTDDNPDVNIAIVAHSHNETNILKIRNLIVRGFSTLCPGSVWLMMTENFADCPDPLQDGWNDWQVTGQIKCGGFPQCTDNIPTYNGTSIEVTNGTASITKYVDVSTLDDRVTLCFRYGNSLPDFNAQMEVQYDTGSGFTSAYIDSKNMVESLFTCRNVCLNLSDLSRAVNNNPNLGIRFNLQSGAPGSLVDLADIRVFGQPNCDGAPHLSIDPPNEQNDGIYTYSVENLTPNDLAARLRTEWADTNPATKATFRLKLEAAP